MYDWEFVSVPRKYINYINHTDIFQTIKNPFFSEQVCIGVSLEC